MKIIFLGSVCGALEIRIYKDVRWRGGWNPGQFEARGPHGRRQQRHLCVRAAAIVIWLSAGPALLIVMKVTLGSGRDEYKAYIVRMFDGSRTRRVSESTGSPFLRGV